MIVGSGLIKCRFEKIGYVPVAATGGVRGPSAALIIEMAKKGLAATYLDVDAEDDVIR